MADSRLFVVPPVKTSGLTFEAPPPVNGMRVFVCEAGFPVYDTVSNLSVGCH